MAQVVQPQRAPALPARNLRGGQDRVEGVAQGRDRVRLAGWRREERLARGPLADFVRDRVPTVRESSRDVGGHGHESGLAELGVVNAEHGGLQIDVRQGEAKAFTGPQPSEVQQDQQRSEDELAPRRAAVPVEGVTGVEKPAAFIEREDARNAGTRLRHLLPTAVRLNGLAPGHGDLTRAALRSVIRGYAWGRRRVAPARSPVRTVPQGGAPAR